MKRRKENFAPGVMLGISLVGFSICYLIPFVASCFYGLVDNPIRMRFVGIQNFAELFRNEYFMRGSKNTVLFMGISIPLGMALSLGAALLVNQRARGNSWFSLVFLIPLVIPSATTAFFWQNLFDRQGVLNHFLAAFGIQGADWLRSRYGLWVMVVIFLWKNIGYNMTLYISGLNHIPVSYYECASVEGAGGWWRFRKITLVYLMPTTFLVLIMSFVNSFKVFKEVYLMTGQYPPDSLYLLQHYMNQMFQSLNYPKLVSSVYLLTVLIVFFVAGVFRLENRVSGNLRA